MDKIVRRPPESADDYRSLGLLCRQQAARHPEASWRWLSEAERYDHLAATAGGETTSGLRKVLQTKG
jgi:hypothetical protein